MGFLLRKYSDYTVDLLVAFNGTEANELYTPTNNVEEAMQYFNIVLKNGIMRIQTEQDKKIEELDDEVKEQLHKINNILTEFVPDEESNNYSEFFP